MTCTADWNTHDWVEDKSPGFWYAREWKHYVVTMHKCTKCGEPGTTWTPMAAVVSGGKE